MRLLIVGIIVHVHLLVSIVHIYKPLRVAKGNDSVCIWERRGAARGVLLLGDELGSGAGRARGRIRLQRAASQSAVLTAALGGVPCHAFGSSGRAETILEGVDVVAYAGPAGVLDEFLPANESLSLTYPRSWISEGPFFRNDEYVLKSVHGLLNEAFVNESLGELLSKKVLFVLYMTSVPLVRLKDQDMRTELDEAEYVIAREIEGLERHIDEYYQDKETVFLALPVLNIATDKFPELTAWGRGVSRSQNQEIELVDMCPLLATLLGVPLPRRSFGRVPPSFLNLGEEEAAKALACNAHELCQLAYQYDPTLPNDMTLNLSRINQYVNQGLYEQSTLISEELTRTAQSQLSTQQRIDKRVFFCNVAALTGWLFLLTSESMIVQSDSPNLSTRAWLFMFVSFVSVATCDYICVGFMWPEFTTYTTYLHMSSIPWLVLLTRYKAVMEWCLRRASLKTLLRILCMVLLEEMLIVLFRGGYPTVLVVSALSALPLVSPFKHVPFVYSAGWYVCCGLIIALLNFPRELFNGKTHPLNLSSTLWLCVGQSSVFFFNFIHDSLVSQILVVYIAITTILANAFALLQSIPPYLYFLSWSSFSALVFPLVRKIRAGKKLMHVCLSHVPPLLLLSRDIECVSYFLLVFFAVHWAFLESSCEATSGDDHLCNIRRGALLVKSCILGYLFLGKIEDHCHASLLSPFLPLHMHWDSLFPFYGFLALKYFLAFTIIMAVYISLVVKSLKSDLGFIYGLILLEMCCLRFQMRFLSSSADLNELVSNHVFINAFGLCFILSYWFGMFYSTKCIKRETRDLNGQPFSSNFVN